jgi:hypothetical protein
LSNLENDFDFDYPALVSLYSHFGQEDKLEGWVFWMFNRIKESKYAIKRSEEFLETLEQMGIRWRGILDPWVPSKVNEEMVEWLEKAWKGKVVVAKHLELVNWLPESWVRYKI